jgi:hypothetical protein
MAALRLRVRRTSDLQGTLVTDSREDQRSGSTFPDDCATIVLSYTQFGSIARLTMEDPPLNESQSHEDAAVEALAHNKNAVAQTHATLAASKALNKLIETVDPSRRE